MIEEVLHHANTFAVIMRAEGCVLSPSSIVNANCYLDEVPARLN